ncbi:MAG TPA: AI-2E family transporter [Rhizomicrobium sp.]|nr:AI-2E family transporter [Rhizomicrobium sp.]
MKINNQSLTNWLLIGAILLAMLYFGRDFFVPLVFALLLWAVINAIVGFLERQKLPPFMAWCGTVALIVISLWFTALVLINQAAAVVDEAPQLAQKVQLLIHTKLPFGNMIPALNLRALAENDSFRGYIGAVAASVGGTLVDLTLIVIYVGFLLAEQGHIPEKIARLQKNNTEAEGEAVVRAIGHQVQTYLGVCTLASAIMAVVTYALLTVMGVDFAAFWALAMFILTYIPTVGAIGVVLPALMALAQFGDFGPALLIAVFLFAVHFLLTSVLETVMLGRTLDLSPFAIILSLTFWGLVWGVGGLFLAVPLTGALAIVCRHLDGLEWFAELIAGSHVVRARRRLKFGT